MPFISSSGTFARDRERLARARTGDDLAIIGPPSKAAGEGPSTNACEEVKLSVSSKLIWVNICDAPFVNVAGGYQVLGNKFAQPCSRLLVEFVVVVHGCT
jgi:hypothetical protein